jgi:hypothetical protein
MKFLNCWLAAAALFVAISAPAMAAVNGKIAYTVCDYNPAVGSKVCDIWAMNPDGTGQTNLTNTPNLNEEQPAWSADGTKIVFVEGLGGSNRFMVMNADGSNQIVITPTPSYQFGPTWSPSGAQIAFVRQVPGITMSIQFDIFVANIDGSNEINITNSDFDEMEPAWSPDGTKIAFAGVRFEQSVDPITGEPYTAAQFEIVTVNPDGTGERILSAGAPGSVRAQFLEEDRAPAWSPDGTALVFMSQSVDPCCTPWQIWRVNSDGSNAVVLSDNPQVDDLWPSFSPDGTLIVFTSDRDYAGTGGQQFDIYTMPAAGVAGAALARAATVDATAAVGSVTRLTLTGNVTDPNWGRDPNVAPQQFTLTVALELQGTNAGGFVVSYPRGIFCGNDCSEVYPQDTAVVLLAVPRIGSRFAGWTGACSASTTFYCVVKMSETKNVGARFVRRR